jgi:hypothetical protein
MYILFFPALVKKAHRKQREVMTELPGLDRDARSFHT